MDATQIIKDHNAIATFIASQGTLGRPTESIKHSQFKQLCAKIDGMHGITAEDATLISSAFEEGPWNDNQKCELATHVATKLSSAPAGGAGRKTQTCDHFENFLNLKRMMVLKSDASITIKIEEIAACAAEIGLRCGNEHALGRMTAVISVIGVGSMLDIATLHDIKVRISERIKALDKKQPYPHSHITTYPILPADLSPEMWNYAYGEGDEAPIDPPGLAVVAAINTEASRKFLRGSAKELQSRGWPLDRGATPGAQSAPIDTRGNWCTGSNNPMQMLMAACMHAMVGGSRDPNINLQLCGKGGAGLSPNLAMFRSRADSALAIADDGAGAASAETLPGTEASGAASSGAAPAAAVMAIPDEPSPAVATQKRPPDYNPILDLVTEMAKANAGKSSVKVKFHWGWI